MKYNAEQVDFMLHEAIDKNREYKSWHCSTQHLMALVERVVAEEREACAMVAAQEPVAWIGYDEGGHKILTKQRQIADAYPELYTIPLYPHPKRPWVDLTNEDLAFLFPHGKSVWVQEMVAIIQAKLKEKNNG